MHINCGWCCARLAERGIQLEQCPKIQWLYLSSTQRGTCCIMTLVRFGPSPPSLVAEERMLTQMA